MFVKSAKNAGIAQYADIAEIVGRRCRTDQRVVGTEPVIGIVGGGFARLATGDPVQTLVREIDRIGLAATEIYSGNPAGPAAPAQDEQRIEPGFDIGIAVPIPIIDGTWPRRRRDTLSLKSEQLHCPGIDLVFSRDRCLLRADPGSYPRAPSGPVDQPIVRFPLEFGDWPGVISMGRPSASIALIGCSGLSGRWPDPGWSGFGRRGIRRSARTEIRHRIPLGVRSNGGRSPRSAVRLRRSFSSRSTGGGASSCAGVRSLSGMKAYSPASSSITPTSLLNMIVPSVTPRYRPSSIGAFGLKPGTQVQSPLQKTAE